MANLAVPRSWPWWLWAEHGVLVGLIGYNAYRLWRDWKARGQASDLSLASTSQPKTDGSLPHRYQEEDQKPELKPDNKFSSTLSIKSSPSQPFHSLLETLPRDALRCLEQIKSLAGPCEVLRWPNVTPAPGASMDMAGLAEGQAATFHDSRGAIYKFKLAEGVYVNMYYTKAGYRRSGDLHDCNQYDVVLRGRTRLRMLDPHNGREVVTEYGANDFIVIPARTPHLFEFLEDNYLLEWWDDNFRAWYYQPYRAIIEAALPLSHTEAQDLSISPKPPPGPASTYTKLSLAR